MNRWLLTVIGVSGVLTTSDMNVRGRFIELRRLAAGTWTRFGRKRLVAYRTNNIYRAVFTIRQRGLRLRGFVPDETAAPCYGANATQAFAS